MSSTSTAQVITAHHSIPPVESLFSLGSSIDGLSMSSLQPQALCTGGQCRHLDNNNNKNNNNDNDNSNSSDDNDSNDNNHDPGCAGSQGTPTRPAR